MAMKPNRQCFVILDLMFLDGAIFWKCRQAWTCEL